MSGGRHFLSFSVLTIRVVVLESWSWVVTKTPLSKSWLRSSASASQRRRSTVFISFYRAMLCMRGTSHGPVSVFASVCLYVSVTSRCSSKTAKHRITRTKPHDSTGILVFWRQRSPRNFTGQPVWGRQMQVGWVKIGDFRQITGYISKTVKDRHIVSIKVE